MFWKHFIYIYSSKISIKKNPKNLVNHRFMRRIKKIILTVLLVSHRWAFLAFTLKSNMLLFQNMNNPPWPGQIIISLTLSVSLSHAYWIYNLVIYSQKNNQEYTLMTYYIGMDQSSLGLLIINYGDFINVECH